MLQTTKIRLVFNLNSDNELKKRLKSSAVPTVLKNYTQFRNLLNTYFEF